MARPRKLIPTCRRHRNGQAVISVYRDCGSRTEIMLPGQYDSKQSRQEYERIVKKLSSHGGKLPANHEHDLTIAELVERFMAHADAYPATIKSIASNCC